MPEWKKGDFASFSKTITESDLHLFGCLCGHEAAQDLSSGEVPTMDSGRYPAHHLLVAGLISDIVGERIAGPGAVSVSQTFRFLGQVYLGDTVTITAEVSEYDRDRGRLLMETVCCNQAGDELITGSAEVKVPSTASPARGGWSQPTSLF